MSLTCCLSFAYFIQTWSYRDMLCTSRSINYMIYLSSSFSFWLQLIIIISSKSHTCLFGHFGKSLASECCFSFCLIFSHFQTGVAYKSIAYKRKSCNHQNLKELAILITHSMKYVNTTAKRKSEAHIWINKKLYKNFVTWKCLALKRYVYFAKESRESFSKTVQKQPFEDVPQKRCY